MATTLKSSSKPERAITKGRDEIFGQYIESHEAVDGYKICKVRRVDKQ
ncbi:15513_t:CDS:2 [Funneliformis mosseae]|uniref:15513_t:CDS:1 n=1 Tax=Funneliformis mosseae TaxID=27381 RepID=A0A9N9H2X4_FUNMO|nr:15513_t:CDS:2 [Funneliformis mosseae]